MTEVAVGVAAADLDALDQELVIDALDDVALEAQVIAIIPSGDPKTHAFEVKLSLPDYDRLYPGMFGKAEFKR